MLSCLHWIRDVQHEVLSFSAALTVQIYHSHVDIKNNDCLCSLETRAKAFNRADLSCRRSNPRQRSFTCSSEVTLHAELTKMVS